MSYARNTAAYGGYYCARRHRGIMFIDAQDPPSTIDDGRSAAGGFDVRIGAYTLKVVGYEEGQNAKL